MRYTSLCTKCRALEMSIQSLRERAESITIDLDPDKVKGSPKIHDPIAEAAASIADTERLLAESRAEAIRTMNEITRTIQQISDDKLQTLLILRYIEGMTWESVAREMAYEERQIYRLHGIALQQIKDVIECQS